MRTTSSLESLNSQLNRSIGRAHPNIFQLIDHLKHHEAFKSNILLGKNFSVQKKQLEPKRKRDRERDSKIKFFTQMLESNQIGVSSFLVSMANKDILPKNRMNSLFIFNCFNNF